MALTEQRKQFVDEYLRLRCKNATQAAINAGYSKKTAQSQASQILKNSNVLHYLEERKSNIASELQQEFVFDALEAQKVMRKIMTDNNAEDRDRLNAAKNLLDRAGFKPKQQIEHSGEISNKLSDIMDQIGGEGLEE